MVFAFYKYRKIFFLFFFTVAISYLDLFWPSDRSDKSSKDVDMKDEIPEECRMMVEG